MLEREVAKRMKYRQICYFRRLHRSLIYKYVHSWPAMQRGARGQTGSMRMFTCNLRRIYCGTQHH